MKNIKQILISIFALCICLSCCFGTTINICFADEQTGVQGAKIKQELNKLIEQTNAQYRIAGSDAELACANYLVAQMESNSSFVPSENSGAISSFKYVSADGSAKTSQNVLFIKDNIQTEKKIVLGAHYDALCAEKDKTTQGINSNLGAVASLLCLAQSINSIEFDYDIEIAFFGAGLDGLAGSNYYTQKLTQDDFDNIVLMINFDNLALGDNLYVYAGENNAKSFQMISNKAKSVGVDVLNEVGAITLCSEENSPLGLNYTHFGLQSDNVNFMKNGVNVLYFFRGNYSSLYALGGRESVVNPNLTYTEKDNMLDIMDIYGETYLDNLSGACNVVNALLADNEILGFYSNQKSDINSVWTNPKFVIISIIALLIIFWGVYRIVFINYIDRASMLAKNSDYVNKFFEEFSNKINEVGKGDDLHNKEITNYFVKKVQIDLQKSNDEKKEKNSADNMKDKTKTQNTPADDEKKNSDKSKDREDAL